MAGTSGRSIISISLFLLLCALHGGPASAADSAITVNVSGLKSSKGTVKIALFVSPSGFPFDTSMAVRTLSVPIENCTAKAVITGVPYGTYAICLFHDEDNTGRLQRSLFGKPREGVGVSNNPVMKKRAPSYQEAQFAVDSEKMTMDIQVVYF